MAEKVIFAEQALTFSVSDGFVEVILTPAPFVLIGDETYRVMVDGVAHELVCIVEDTGATSIAHIVTDGNGDPVNGSFQILYGSKEITEMDGGVVQIALVDATGTENHSIAIYQIIEEESYIIVKDRDGNDAIHKGVSRIRTRTEDGGTKEFRDVDSIRIEPLEITESGAYTAPDGVDGYSPVTVTAPEPVLQDKTITENGEYTADEGFDGLGKVLVDVMQSVSSGELLCKSFSFKPTSTKGVRVEYDIGFNPDVIFVSIEAHKTVTTYNGIVYFGISKAVADKLGSNGTNMILEHSSSSVYRSGYIADIRSDYDASMPISAADATGFNLGKYAPANMYYKCYVIGGLS